jgi:Flp pilus assembly protein TadD
VTPATPSAKKVDWIWGLLLLVATVLAYQPAWNGQAVWDDAAHMTKPALRSGTGLVSIWTRLGATQQYYPLVHTVFWLEYHLWGDSTAGYHLLNILLHFVSAFLLSRIVRRLGFPGAWLAAGIFALHPVMVESVAWITELKNTLSGAFFFGSALAYLTFDDQRKTKHYASAFLLFFIGLLAKSVIATLPAALLVVLWWRRGKISWQRDVMPLVPFFVVGAASGLFTAWVERRFIGAEGADFDFSLIERCLIAGRALWFYLYKLIWPAKLVFIYPRWHIDATAVWQYLFPAAFLLVMALGWALRHRSRGPLAALLCFAVTLAPALGFFNVYPFLYSFVADHFQYLASAGPIVAVAAGTTWGSERLRSRLRFPVHLPLAGVLLVTLFTLSWRQSRMYVDAETLYRTTVERNADCWMAHTHLGLLLMEKGRHDEAMVHLRRALEIHPKPADAHSNLGLLLMDMGRDDESAVHLLKALEINPRQADAHNNLGALLARKGRLDEAAAHLRKALELHPDHAEVHYNLGDLLARRGRMEEAIAHYRQALAIHPDYADAHNNLGLLLAKMGRPAEAVACFRRAVKLSPDHANAHNNLGVMLGRMGRTGEAIAHYRKAWEVDPLEIDHLENLVSALVKWGQWRDATRVLETSLELARSAADEGRAQRIAQNLTELHRAVDASRARVKADAH